MSSYGNYASWKSNLTTNRYKANGPCSYNRANVTAPRFGSIITPSQRSSFSGGICSIKNESVPSVRTTTTKEPYLSRFGTTAINILPPSTNNNQSNTQNSIKTNPKKRFALSTDRYSRYFREVSPATVEKSSHGNNRVSNRMNVRAISVRSHEPSSVVDTQCTTKYSGMNSNKLVIQRPINSSVPGYSPRCSKNFKSTVPSTLLKTNSVSEQALSYLTVSDARARCTSRLTRSKFTEFSNSQHNFQSVNVTKNAAEKLKASPRNPEKSESLYTNAPVARSISPTPSNSTTTQLSPRLETLKTSEKKTMQLSKKETTIEKEIQSKSFEDLNQCTHISLNDRLSSYNQQNDISYGSDCSCYSVNSSSQPKFNTSTHLVNKSKTDELSAVKKCTQNSPCKYKVSQSKIKSFFKRKPLVESQTVSKSDDLPTLLQKTDSPIERPPQISNTSIKLPKKELLKSAMNATHIKRSNKAGQPSSKVDSNIVLCLKKDAQLNHEATLDLATHENSVNVGSDNSCSLYSAERQIENSDDIIRQRCPRKQKNSSARIHANMNFDVRTKSHCHKACTTSNDSESCSSTTVTSPERQTKYCKNAKEKFILKARNTNGECSALFSQQQCSKKSYEKVTKQFNDVAENSSTTQSSTASEQANHAFTEQHKEQEIRKENSINRLQKFSSASNVLTIRHSDVDNKPIYLESSKRSGDLNAANSLAENSITEDFKTNTSPAVSETTVTLTLGTLTTKRDSNANIITRSPSLRYNFHKNLGSSDDISVGIPPCQPLLLTKSEPVSDLTSKELYQIYNTACFPSKREPNSQSCKELYSSDSKADLYETHIETTTSSPEHEEPSWGQHTSSQIDTACALDSNSTGGMHLQLRHIDSGETAWWLRNDESDTLADNNIETLNHEDETSEQTDDATCSEQSNTHIDKSSLWTEKISDEHYANDQNTTNCCRSNAVESSKKSPETYAQVWETKQIARSRYTPEQQWWTESTDNTDPEDTKEEQSLQNSSVKPEISTDETEEKFWWLEGEHEKYEPYRDDSATCGKSLKLSSPTNANFESDTINFNKTSPTVKNDNTCDKWWMAGPPKILNLRRVDSGEKPWWQQENSQELVEVQPESSSFHLEATQIHQNGSNEKSENFQFQLEHEIETMQSEHMPHNGNYSKNSCEDNDENDYNNFAAKNNGNQMQHKTYCNFKDKISTDCSAFGVEQSNYFNLEISERQPPIGKCASPIELIPPDWLPQPHCSSPHGHIPNTKNQNTNKLTLQNYQRKSPKRNESVDSSNEYFHKHPRQTRKKLFISRHQNIDELLGSSYRPISPLFFDGVETTSAATLNTYAQQFPSTYAVTPMNRNLFLEEVTPDQVRIHDSTAQIPVIRRIERNEWDNNAASIENSYAPFHFQNRQIDDAAIQVYRDGDYGAYLDLESSLGEQAEEIEGLNSSRKNSLVVRTQLSVRVHAIIEKLLSSEGSELRRSLFSLKQVFQEDKDLVHAFVALGGLNCLVRVGNGADQNYQNYILRALGQVMLYVDGMNGVMKHEPTMQWLYTLISSSYRSVVKTALKLLLVFVEYAKSNCCVLVKAIHAVDNMQGTLPWSHIMRLLKDYENADAELVIYATSLINKTLAGLDDQDSFYDESDLLEQQGMETVIQRYVSKPDTDLDLLDQLQLYDAVLKFEDGETEDKRFAENSQRKTQRFRLRGDTAERRKSSRHSTGASPSVLKKVIPLPKTLTPSYGLLDEDSSSSTNSTDINGCCFDEKKDSRDSTDVTPGLRRRRERAERHKTFLKEQQETANSIEKRDKVGQIVKAIPASIESSDSPAESFVLTNEYILTPQSIIKNNKNDNVALAQVNVPVTDNMYDHINHDTKSLAWKNNINNSSYNNKNQKLASLSPTCGTDTTSISNKDLESSNESTINLQNQRSPELITKNNLLNERNSAVIAGIMKNMQRSQDSQPMEHFYEQKTYDKFKIDAKLLNDYYNQLNSTPKHQFSVTPNNTQQQPKEALDSHALPTEEIVIWSPGVDVQISQNISPRKICKNHELAVSSSKMFSGHSLIGTEGKGQQQEPIPSKDPILTYSSTTNHTTPPPPAPNLYGYHGFPIPTPTVHNDYNKLRKTQIDTDIMAKDKPSSATLETESEEKTLMLQLKRDHTVKDLTRKLNNLPMSPTHEEKLQQRLVGDMTGLISKAKEGLAKSKSKGELSSSSSIDQPELKKNEPKKSENELHWEELVRNMNRPLNLCDLDFTDLNSDDEKDVLSPRGLGAGVPPPPPPLGVAPPSLLMSMNQGNVPMVQPPMYSCSGYSNASINNSVNGSMNRATNNDLGSLHTIRKNKKTVKLFWKEVREDMIPAAVGKTIWDELPTVNVDTQKLEHLFESRAKDLMTKKQQEMNKSKEIIVLDHKRSNAINIAMKKLPPPRAIKAAILKMDATVVTREGIDKLLNMLPTDEERSKIQEAQMSNPEVPLGSAEQFLLTLASISELGARLKLWAFRLDFDNSEKEIAEPLMDLKQGIEILRNNRTFKCILSTLLTVGIFLNGAPVKGFQIEYLAKVPEVKDTVHKHSLLHHLCYMIMESDATTTDLYSEIGPITRASKADFNDLAHNLSLLETECKSSWDRLKLISKHDCPPQLKQKLVDFLAECAERIIILQIVHRRVINRYRKFLLWLGMSQHTVSESRPNEFCRIVSEFALEYRTTRERVQQQIEKKANHRERNKTRGKLIVDIAKIKTKEDRADAELKELLGTTSADQADASSTWRRRRVEKLHTPASRQSEENFTDGDDEILESLVKTATKAPGTRTAPRERKRTRNTDRKSLRRTLKNGLTDEEKQHIAAIFQTY